jgi:hypothetical protein
MKWMRHIQLIVGRHGYNNDVIEGAKMSILLSKVALRYTIAIVLALLLQHAWSAEVLIGTATLKFQDPSEYQPGSCARTATELPDGGVEICIAMRSWDLYEAVEFRDLKGEVHSVSTIVASAHQVLSGEWLLVLEKLSDEDAVKFDAKFKVIDRSPIMPVACLENPINEYTTEEMPTPGVIPGLGTNCYNMWAISRK